MRADLKTSPAKSASREAPGKHDVVSGMNRGALQLVFPGDWWKNPTARPVARRSSDAGGERQMKSASVDTRRSHRRQVAAQRTRSARLSAEQAKMVSRISSEKGRPSSSSSWSPSGDLLRRLLVRRDSHLPLLFHEGGYAAAAFLRARFAGGMLGTPRLG
ncbi:hypothetical protein EJB05_33490, partial [Eragrostis curvula]